MFGKKIWQELKPTIVFEILVTSCTNIAVLDMSILALYADLQLLIVVKFVLDFLDENVL